MAELPGRTALLPRIGRNGIRATDRHDAAPAVDRPRPGSEARIWLDRLLALPHNQPTEPHAKALYLSSVFAAMQGDIPLSTTRFTAGDAELAQLPDDNELAVFAQYAAGSIVLYWGEPARAVPELEAAVATAQQRRFLFCHVGGLFALGLSHMTLDDPPKAGASHQRLVALTEELGERIYRGRTCSIGVGPHGGRATSHKRCRSSRTG